MKLFSFEKLNVWELGREFTKNIYNISKSFPDEEKFGLTSQIRRASISITSNIAEGTSRITGKEQARFTEISFSSLLEVLNQLIVAVDLGYISNTILEDERLLIEEIANKLNKLRQSQLNRETNKQIKQINK